MADDRDLVPVSGGSSALHAAPDLPGLTLDDAERVQAYVEKASADATRRAYASDWRLFTAWCEVRALASLPASPETVAAFLAAQADAGLARATIGRRLAAIAYVHRICGQVAPADQPNGILVETTMRGIRRDQRGNPSARKQAACGDVLRDMLRAIEGDSIRSVRDRALLAIGMGGALRRSELVGIDLAHLTRTPKGLEIHLPSSKTDQEGKGALVVIPDRDRIAPVKLLDRWLEAASIDEGPVFLKLTPQGRLTARRMSDRGVAIVVQQRAAAAGYDPRLFGGHSLRAGFLTEAGRQGANVFRMKDHSRHRSLEMVSEYVRSQDLFRDHAGDGFL
jgi:site-specific recombinase XerD